MARRSRWSVRVALAAALVATVPAAAATASAGAQSAGTQSAGTQSVGTRTATAAACSVTWGSLPKRSPAMTSAPLTNVRSGRHECYDRLVVDIAGTGAGYTVQYVTQVTEDGSGDVVPLRGAGKIQITVNAPAYDEHYNPTYWPANPSELTDVAGYRTFRQVAWAGSFEGYSTIGLGVRARLPFRVMVLDGPGTSSRVVVDVAHSW